MITGVSFCPHPPALVPSVAGSAAAELEELRAACLAAIADLRSSGPDQIVLIGSAPASAAHSPVARGSLAGYGVDLEVHLGSPGCGGDVDLPLSLTVGAWLLGQAVGPRSAAVGYSVGPDFAASRHAAELLGRAERERLGLLVLGDGSARRTERAPGYLDPRASDFDDEVAAALAGGDGEALSELDVGLGAELLAAGVPAWRAAGALLAGDAFDSRLIYRGDPYGVAYFVASWTAAGD